MIALRLVLDTNVIVSALLQSAGRPRSVLTIALSKPAQLFVTSEILHEYRVVLARPRLRIQKGMASRFLALIEKRSKQVVPRRRLRIAADPDDDIFLECAERARADYLVTGNIGHFPTTWRATQIVTPTGFLELIAPYITG